MRLYLYGHDYKYAAEQILLTLFPAERPEYPAGKPEGDRLEIRLSRGERFTTASCRLHIGGKSAVGRAAVKNDALSGDLIRDRYCQRLIKNAVYRAARSYGIEPGVGRTHRGETGEDTLRHTRLRRFGG